MQTEKVNNQSNKYRQFFFTVLSMIAAISATYYYFFSNDNLRIEKYHYYATISILFMILSEIIRGKNEPIKQAKEDVTESEKYQKPVPYTKEDFIRQLTDKEAKDIIYRISKKQFGYYIAPAPDIKKSERINR